MRSKLKAITRHVALAWFFATPTFAAVECSLLLVRGVTTLADLRQTVTQGSQVEAIPSLSIFGETELKFLKSGHYDRAKTLADLTEAQKCFQDLENPDVENIISGHGVYQIRKKGTTRWNPIARETKTNSAARAMESKIMHSLAKNRVSLIEHLSPFQQKALRHFLTNTPWDQPLGLKDIADAVGVARALSLAESTLLEGRSIAEWEEAIEHNNVTTPKLPGYQALLVVIDDRIAAFLRATEETVESLCEGDPEKECAIVANEILQNKIGGFASNLKQDLLAQFPALAREITDLCHEISLPENHSDWLAHMRSHGYADPSEVRAAAAADGANPQLRQMVETVDAFGIKLLDGVAKQAQRVWESDPHRSYAGVLNELLLQELMGAELNLRRVLGRFTGFGNAPKLLRKELTALRTHLDWSDRQRPNMSFGENIIIAKPVQVTEISAEKLELVESLARLGDIGGEADLLLLKQILSTIDGALLKELIDAKYTVTVARNNVTNGARDLRARSASSGITVDNAEGVHALDPKTGERRILVRSKMQDGKIVLNTGVLLHEIGHAIDLVLRAKGNEFLHVNKSFVDAFTQEHQLLPPYFHTQVDFVAEIFARYALDPERTMRELPLSCLALEELGLSKNLVDGAQLVLLHKSMLAEAPVTARPNGQEVLRSFENLNNVRETQGKAREPIILELEGEPAATMALAKQMGSYLVTLRAPTISPFGVFDGLVHVGSAEFNNPATLAKVLDGLSGGNGALLYIDDLRNIPTSSPGFRVLADYIERTRDRVYVVLVGNKESRKPFNNLFPQVLRKLIEIDPLTATQVAELVKREVSNDGYEFSEQAMATLSERASAGGYEAAMKLWGSIKQEQAARTLAMEQDIKLQPAAVSYVLSRDVDGASVAKKNNPIDEILKMVGLTQVKEKIMGIIAEVSLTKQADDLGYDHADPPRLNLLFAGNPGTGKTTVALKLAQSLFELGYVRTSAIAEMTVQDILGGNPEANVKKLFEQNRDGVIFIDEFHQLKNTEEGKRAFRAMIPYLANPEYARTVFIGAGYPDELLELIREIDPGGERRFVMVPFEDFERQQMWAIAEFMLGKNRLAASEDVKKVLVENVVRKQRTMKHPGNAGDMERILGLAREKQRARLAIIAGQRKLTREDFGTLTLEDVVIENSLTPESVLAEIDALKGMEAVKAQLRKLQALMSYNRARGDDVLSGIEPYIILEGPPGSGKTTIAALIGKLFAANDVIPDKDLVKALGGDLVGGYIGNSTTIAVRKLFEKAWGKTLFIDEIGALAKAVGGYEEQAAKEMLAQMENHRGKFVLVIADYSENIDDFFRLDAGLPRRFGLRLTLEAMSGPAAAELLHNGLAVFKLDASHLNAIIETRLTTLAALPGWASGGDMRTLANKIRTNQASAFVTAHEKGQVIDTNKVDLSTLESAIDDLEADIRKRPDPRHNRSNGAAGNFAHQHERQHSHQPKSVTVSSEDKLHEAAIGEVAQQFGKRFNDDPEELTRQEEDPQSDYNVALAEKLGVTPEKAKEIRIQVKLRVKKLVTLLEKREVQHFKYHCPYCGGIDSPSCGYINQSLEWKIEHSLRKPWSEDVIVERQVEVEEDQIQERRIP